jgi:hypothetical protein
MPPLETDCRQQKAVLWSTSGFAADGDHKVNAGIVIDVRIQKDRMKMTNAQGNIIAVDAVFVVDRTIAVGSILWIGELKDVPTPPTDLLEVKTSSETPDLKGRHVRRLIGVTRFGNTLPDLNS